MGLSPSADSQPATTDRDKRRFLRGLLEGAEQHGLDGIQEAAAAKLAELQPPPPTPPSAKTAFAAAAKWADQAGAALAEQRSTIEQLEEQLKLAKEEEDKLRVDWEDACRERKHKLAELNEQERK
eukprot:15476206-Alexandrium_andersonii.AAC.1